MPSVEWNRRWGNKFAEFSRDNPGGLYGLQWGDPELRGLRYYARRFLHHKPPAPLFKVVDKYIRPYLTPGTTVLEIGPGGGRWTRYLVSAKKLILVDLNAEFFAGLKELFPKANLEFYQPQGCDLRGVPDDTVDFVFTFGTFVHVEPEGIHEYLLEIRRVLRSGGIASVQYAEKRKPKAQINPWFSDMTADKMEAMAPMPIVEHNTRLLNHSNIVVMRKSGRSTAA